MVDVDEVQGYGAKFQNQLERLEKADIDERDREAIGDWVRRLDADNDRNQGTVVSLLNRARLAAERGETPLVEMERTDVDALLFTLKHDYELSDGTRRNYRKAVKQFLRWHTDGAEWVEEMTIGASPDRNVDPNDLLTDDEIQALLDAAEKPRDKALIAILADTGLRISAIASLRIRDLDRTGRTTTVSINDEAHVKGANGTIPLTWSESHLASYLDVHPRPTVDDAPVLHKDEGYYDGDGDDGALVYHYLSTRVKRVADDAGVDREKCNLHNFRHTAISNWIREGLSEQAIKHRATWGVDSDMIGVYEAVRDEELNDQILDHYDIADVDGQSAGPAVDECYRCETALRGTERFCPNCSAALETEAADAVEGVEDRVFESGTTVDGVAGDLVAEFRDRFNSDAEFRRDIVGALTHDDSTSLSS